MKPIENRDGADVMGPVRAMTGGRGADVVIEAVGLPEVWQLATRLLRRGGVVNFFGGCPSGTEIKLDTNLLHYSELTCKASFHHTPGAGSQGSGSRIARLHFRQGPGESRGAAGQSAGSDATPDEPQRAPEDGDHPLIAGPSVSPAPSIFWRPPDQMHAAWTREESLAYTRWLATHHYENFQVVSFLLPKRLHQDFYNVYAFCRWADDLGDEIGDTQESLRLLAWWRGELQSDVRGRRYASRICRPPGDRRATTTCPSNLRRSDQGIRTGPDRHALPEPLSDVVRILPLFGKSCRAAGAGIVRLS